MISISDKKYCSGCNACVQKCPKHCIKMVEDEEGFLYPSVNKNECVDCGFCEKVCPVINAKEDKQKVAAYAAYANDDDIRMKSSSGGLFTLFADQILKDNGVVFGAAFDIDFMVHHVAIESVEELSRLQGSKYLQSRIENTYQQAEQYLKSGRKVLFTGTACQIAGLKQYLGKEYDLLYTVDVLCHGVPSPKVWKRYLNYQEKYHGGAVTRTIFRQKEFGWKSYALKLQFSNSSAYEQIFQKDLFMQMFLSNICLRPSCHACKFKSLDRPSDITIGDSWGIGQYMPDMDDDKGTSVVLIHSEKGQKLFDLCESEMLFKEAEVDKILPPTADSRKSVAMHSGRKNFFKELNDGSSILKLENVLKPSLLRRVLRKCKAVVKKMIR
ncbi:4Fe-4S dicluster domain-containing protein [Anaerocolumna sedimenticola]|uniref:4Fe-4S dicluster domain-containing protein n=1 Tax=Anaerocolumna sedimenticola TaxID=2696063 RepID=A0A6P1TJY8_9FIRM|nr:Coenzyme F420 hydrogenase/dehydrogenase, beta subunit C-terminal domain [Anaerocolumna sedimenticola]QHQ59955.1 4Fe-4S dicluster domain-containing protein [Anaerocolumna sedimenticola]